MENAQPSFLSYISRSFFPDVFKVKRNAIHQVWALSKKKTQDELFYFGTCLVNVLVFVVGVFDGRVKEDGGGGKWVGSVRTASWWVEKQAQRLSRLLANHPTSVASRVSWHHDQHTHVRVLIVLEKKKKRKYGGR